MRSTSPPLLNVLAPVHELVDAVLKQVGDPAQRPALLTEMLRTLWPSAPLYACLLQAGGQGQVSVRDEAGVPRPAWEDLLRDKLAKGPTGKRTAPRAVKLPRAIKLPGHALAVEDITFAERRWGAFALARPDNISAEADACVRVVLTTCAEQLALRLYLEAHEQELQALRGLLEEQATLADAGELAGPVMHAVNNFFNVVSLHLAVLEPEVPEAARAELAEIRRQGNEAAALVRQFQQYRAHPRSAPGLIDLNRAVREAVEDLCRAEVVRAGVPRLALVRTGEGTGPLAPGRVPVHLELAPELPPVPGSFADLKRLCNFLVRNAAVAASLGTGAVWVRTEKSGQGVLLRVEDAGPSLEPASLVQLFEPGPAGRDGLPPLELAACRSLAKRHQGTIRAENRAEGGVAIFVELPAK